MYGNVRFCTDAEVVLDAALGRETVVVPSHRVDDVPAGHAPVSCDDVLMGVGEDVAGMEGTAGGRRRRVDDEALFAGCGFVVLRDAEGVPLGTPVCFALFDVEASGEVARVDGDDFVVGGFGCHWRFSLCPSDISPVNGGSLLVFGGDTKKPVLSKDGAMGASRYHLCCRPVGAVASR